MTLKELLSTRGYVSMDFVKAKCGLMINKDYIEISPCIWTDCTKCIMNINREPGENCDETFDRLAEKEVNEICIKK